MSTGKPLNKKALIASVGIGFLALVTYYSFTLPFSNGFSEISLFKKLYLVGSIICGIAFLTFVIIISIKNGKKYKIFYYNIFYASPIAILEMINILMICDNNLWGYQSSALGLFFIYVLFIGFFASIRTLFKKSFGYENIPVVLISLVFISFILATVNEGVGNIEPANLCYKFCVGLAYLVAISLYVNKYIYKAKDSTKPVSNIIGIIFWGAIITITFPYYIQWCGLTGTSFETFVSVYAAVLGGGITLAGVAWTIKDAENKRKEEERKKHIPYVQIAHNDQALISATIQKIHTIDILNSEDRKKITGREFCSLCKLHFLIKNISSNNIVLHGAFIDEFYYEFETGALVEKDSVCEINIGDEKGLSLVEEIKTIQLKISDVIENYYIVDCIFEYVDTDRRVEYIIKPKVKYYGQTKNCKIEGFKLPKLMSEELNR